MARYRVTIPRWEAAKGLYQEVEAESAGQAKALVYRPLIGHIDPFRYTDLRARLAPCTASDEMNEVQDNA